MNFRMKWSNFLAILFLFIGLDAACIFGVSEPLSFVPHFGGSCGRELSCTAGSAVAWSVAMLFVAAVEWLFPD